MDTSIFHRDLAVSSNKTLDMNVGIVHDWLPTFGGAERVVQQMVNVCPNSELYTLFDFLNDDDRRAIVQGKNLHLSYLNNLPHVKKYYRYLISSCMKAIESFDVSSHDVILSSSAALAKGVITNPGQCHIAYVHSPARYAWDLTHDYINSLDGFAGGIKRHIAHNIMHKFRIWDVRTSPSIDVFVANSEFIKNRIWKVYRRDAEVLYPPVDVSSFALNNSARNENYLTVTRLVPYKNVPLIVEAFNKRPKLKLKIVGDGPDLEKIKSIAGPNVEIMGHVSFDVVVKEMQTAKAFVFAALEDFGISPVEAQACGTPVIALGKGGTSETVRPMGVSNPTGVWFKEQTVESLLEAIDAFESDGHCIKPEDCRSNAEKFSASEFRNGLHKIISSSAR